VCAVGCNRAGLRNVPVRTYRIFGKFTFYFQPQYHKLHISKDIMQDARNDYTSPAEEQDMDMSTSYENSIDNNDNDNDNDNDMSESETSLQEEAVLPETDRINLACPGEFGYTKIYQVEQDFNDGRAGTKLAIPKVSLYFERGKKLQHLNMIEYACLIRMEQKKTEKDDSANDCTVEDHEESDGLPPLNTKKTGRQSSSRFEYNTNCAMQRLFQQLLATKQSLPFVIGNAPPKRPGKKPLRLNDELDSKYEKRLDSWQRQANIFAKYYLLLFRPTSRHMRESEFTFEALENWITDCRTSKNWLKESRLAMFNNRLNGMSISCTNKKLITAYRGRCRTIWTDEERYNHNEHFSTMRAQRTEDLEASGLTSAEYNLEHSNLGNDVNKRIKKQENDISHIRTTLEGLLLTPSLESLTRYDHDERKRLSSFLPLSSHIRHALIHSSQGHSRRSYEHPCSYEFSRTTNSQRPYSTSK
jgi:hypothetical protein